MSRCRATKIVMDLSSEAEISCDLEAGHLDSLHVDNFNNLYWKSDTSMSHAVIVPKPPGRYLQAAAHEN